VDSLSHELPGRVRDLSGEAKTSWDAPSDVVRGYALIGMDTAGFKPTDEEGKKAAPYTRSTGGSSQKRTQAHRPLARDEDDSKWPSCVDPDPTSVSSADRRKELERVESLTANTTQPFLLFTHIPDLKDLSVGANSTKTRIADSRLHGWSIPRRRRFGPGSSPTRIWSPCSRDTSTVPTPQATEGHSLRRQAAQRTPFMSLHRSP
jgi:hypothetical protein